MNLSINTNSTVPVYQQISNQIAEQISLGFLTADTKLPAERALGEQLGVARNTIKQALLKLEYDGYIKIVQGSGSYVTGPSSAFFTDRADEIMEKAIGSLKERGCTQPEIDRLLLESAWCHIPVSEQPVLVWVDCSPELIHFTAKEIETFCRVQVIPYTCKEVERDPAVLLSRNFNLIATSVHHYDVLKKQLKELCCQHSSVNQLPVLQMASLSVDTHVISEIVKNRENVSVAAVCDSTEYRNGIEHYLQELGFKGTCEYILLEQAETILSLSKQQFKTIILPPDLCYKNGAVKGVKDFCTKNNIETFTFNLPVDQGSLFHLKQQAQNYWLKSKA